MTEATSHCFVATIGAAAPDLETRLSQWASTSCQAHCVVRDGDGRVSLYLQRKEAKTARAMQSLIRTLTGRWGLHMGDLGKGWLELCNKEAFRAAARIEGGEGPCAHAVPPQNTEHAAPPQPACDAGNLLFSLSPDFDRRAEEMYQSLLAAQATN